MKIYFIRHGESEQNKKELITGHIDSVLSEEGIKQAEEALLNLDTDYSEIYSSDLTRCKHTAEILNKNLNIPIFYDPRLRERHFGSLEGMSWNDIDPTIREKDRHQHYDYREFGGESVDDVKSRVLAFINDIKESKNDKKILVVTSGGVIRLLHNIINGEVHGKIKNSSVHEFKF